MFFFPQITPIIIRQCIKQKWNYTACKATLLVLVRSRKKAVNLLVCQKGRTFLSKQKGRKDNPVSLIHKYLQHWRNTREFPEGRIKATEASPLASESGDHDEFYFPSLNTVL